MAQLVYRAHVTDQKGRVQQHDLVIGGGTMTAEEVVAHLNETGHFDKHKPSKIVVESEPVGQVEETVAQVINRRGKMKMHRVAEVAPPKETKAETAEVDLERESKSPTLTVPITEPVDNAEATLPAPTETDVDHAPESPVAEVGSTVAIPAENNQKP